MTKRITALLMALMMIFSFALLTSCGEDEPEDQGGLPINGDDGDDEVSLTAPDGSTVELPETIEKIVTVSPAAKSIIEQLGAGSKITASYDVTADATNDIVSAKPEVVLYDEGAAIDIAAIEAADIVAIKLPTADSMATVKAHITFVGKMLGIGTESVVEAITKAFTSLQITSSAWDKPSVYVELGNGDDGYYTVAPYSYVYEMVSSAGGNNIFGSSSEYEGFITVTADEIIAANPAVIFTTGAVEDITGREGWSEIAAVANGHVYSIENLIPSGDAVAAAQSMSEFLEAVVSNTAK